MFLGPSLRNFRPLIPSSLKQLRWNLHFSQFVVQQPFAWEEPDDNYSRQFDAVKIAMQKKRKLEIAAQKKRRKLYANVHAREGTNDEVLGLEVQELLQQAADERTKTSVSESSELKQYRPIEGGFLDLSTPEPTLPIELEKEAEFEIVKLSSTGDGLAYSSTKDHIVVIPFAIPGDTVLARPYKWDGFHSSADFIKLIKPSPLRDGVTPGCKHFGTCSGCQLQMMSYNDQLEHKKKIVENAFKNFSGLDSNQIPQVGNTMPSPQTYAYRTKITPHYKGPKAFGVSQEGHKSVPPFGFNEKGRPSRIVDIESCPISSDIVQAGLTRERSKIAATYSKIRSGATVLIRENTRRESRDDISDSHSLNGTTKTPTLTIDQRNKPESTSLTFSANDEPVIKTTYPTYIDTKTYTSDNNSLVTEYVGDFRFVNKAGSFFQNNSSILGPFTAYVHSLCAATMPIIDPQNPAPPIKYLLDAYCGSGLFAITLSSLFSSALGIDVDQRSIQQARHNAEINDLHNIGFIDADAADLFADVPFPPEQTLTIIDPPRRGASEDFLRQLCTFGPKRVVYVSCNVHSQARDIGMLVNGFADTFKGQSKKEEEMYWSYEIESLRGADFFPQTGHVEGVAVLNRVEKGSKRKST